MEERLKFRNREAEAVDPRSGGPRPRPEETLTPEERLEDYLDRVLAPLVETVPYRRRRELRAELRAHLEALVEAHTELGAPPGQAILLALERFGDPSQIGREWLRAREDAPAGGYESPLPALTVGLVLFTPAALLGAVAASAHAAAHPGLQGGPIPLFLALPVLAGLLVGLCSRSRGGFGSFLSAAAVTLAGALLLALQVALLGKMGFGSSQWPAVASGLPLVPLLLVQFAWWLPASALFGALGERLRPRARRALTELLRA